VHWPVRRSRGWTSRRCTRRNRGRRLRLIGGRHPGRPHRGACPRWSLEVTGHASDDQAGASPRNDPLRMECPAGRLSAEVAGGWRSSRALRAADAHSSGRGPGARGPPATRGRVPHSLRGCITPSDATSDPAGADRPGDRRTTALAARCSATRSPTPTSSGKPNSKQCHSPALNAWPHPLTRRPADTTHGAAMLYATRKEAT
jgi:hypothetical protein